MLDAPRIPVSYRSTLWIGAAILCTVFVLGVSWAVFTPLATAVVATGVVKVDSSRKQIQHLEGGIVKEILVRDGDRVQTGDVLLRLDKTKAEASLGVLAAAERSALAQQARLVAEREERATLEFPEALLNAPGDDPETLEAQRSMFAARKAAFDGQLEIFDQQIKHLNQDIKGLSFQQKSRKRQISIVGQELKALKGLLSENLVERTRVLGLEKELANLEGELGELQSESAAKQTAIAEKELEKFQLSKNRQEEVVLELKKVQQELLDLTERLNAARHVLDHIDIRSPVTGVVVNTDVHTVGGVVRPGQVVLELVPENDQLVVEARVRPQDIDGIEPGLAAGVKLSSFEQRSTPELAGRVKYVSADILEEERSGEIYYLARIAVGEDEVARLEGKRIQPGMPAEVFIRTGQRTAAEYLIQPLADSFRRAWLER